MAKSKISSPQSRPYTVKDVKLDVTNPSQVKRIAIEIDGINRMTGTYEGRVFFNNPHANSKTPLKVEMGYVGSFFMFGHGTRCFGGKGHCDYKTRDSPYDLRRERGTGPGFRRVTITKKQIIKKVLKKIDNKITIVPIPLVYDEMTDTENIFRFKKLTINVQ